MASVRLVQISYCFLLLIMIHGSYGQNAWNKYWEDWKKTTKYPRMYPYGTAFKDKKMLSSEVSGIDPKIKFKIPFYGTDYSSTVISYYGYIAFPFQTALYLTSNWPNPDYPNSPDPPFVTPFYSDNSISPRGDTLGDVFWRTLDERDYTIANDKEIVAGMLNEISYQVRAAVVGADLFVAKYGLVATWDQLTFSGPPCNGDKCPLNTYQTVIVTDEINTYALFSYWNVTWIGGSNQNCDPQTGKPSSSYPNCKQAVVGFNSGYGRAFTHLPYSGTNDVEFLDDRSGTNITGQFIYSVAGDRVVRGGCYNETTKLENWNLEIAPNYGSQLGGNLVNISGPCFDSRPGSVNLKCQFDDQVVTGYVDPTNHMKAFCVAPQLNVRGEIDLSVSLNGRVSDYRAKYHVVPIDKESPQVMLSEDWYQSDPQSLKLNWNPNALDHDKNLRVDVLLFGYMETTNGAAQWTELAAIQKEIKNGDGKFTFNTRDHRANDSTRSAYEVGAIKISVNTNQNGPSEDPKNPRGIWSEIIPLGWYVADAMKKEHGNNWPTSKCTKWKNGDGPLSNWGSELHSCPCRYEQAYTNFGRWLPDADCDYSGDSDSKVCRFHPGAKHCVRSAFPTEQGSGNQCCYDQSGHLLYSEDSASGSTPDKSHPLGLAKFKTPPKVPTMSHWLRDVIPQFYCCRWSNNCGTYLERRKTVGCKTYKSPKHALAFGDPHFHTFDGKEYTFNGKGEFWLMRIEEFTSLNYKVDMQGRFEQPKNKSWGAIKSTLLTSVVIAQKLSYPVQIQVHQHPSTSKNKLSVFVNKDEKLFNTPHRRRDFDNGKIIIMDTSASGTHQSNFTVILSSGVAMRVTSMGDHIHVITEVPEDTKGKTKGLYGWFDGNPANDLMPKSSKTPVTSTNLEIIHRDFGLSWSVSNPESLFKYIAKMDAGYFRDLNFKPNFQTRPPPAANVTEAMVQQLCGNDGFCQFDYRVTADRNIGSDTLHENKWFVQLEDLMSKPVNSCGILPVPHAIRNGTSGYLIGSVVTIKGCDCDCTLQGGKTRFECTKQSDGSGIWVPSVSGVSCTPNSELANRSRMAAAIAVPIVLVVLIAIIAVAAFIIFKKKKEQKANQQNTGRNDTEAKGGNTDTKKPYSYPRPNLNPDPTKEPKPAEKPTNDAPVRAAAPDNPYAQYENRAVTPEDIAMEAVVAREVALEAAARREMAYNEAAKREMELEHAARKEAELVVAARLAEEHISRSRRGSKDSAV